MLYVAAKLGNVWTNRTMSFNNVCNSVTKHCLDEWDDVFERCLFVTSELGNVCEAGTVVLVSCP